MKVFHNDDDAYEQWVGRMGGYVLTVSSGSPSYMLHDSDCIHLQTGGMDIGLTKKPRRWAQYRRDLVEWVEQETTQKPKLCRTCM